MKLITAILIFTTSASSFAKGEEESFNKLSKRIKEAAEKNLLSAARNQTPALLPIELTYQDSTKTTFLCSFESYRKIRQGYDKLSDAEKIARLETVSQLCGKIVIEVKIERSERS